MRLLTARSTVLIGVMATVGFLIWQVRRGEGAGVFLRLQGVEGPGGAFSEDGHLLAIGASGGGVCLFDARTGRRMRILPGPPIMGVLAYAGGRGVLVGDGGVPHQIPPRPLAWLWDSNTGRREVLVAGVALRAAIAPGGKALAVSYSALDSNAAPRLVVGVWDLTKPKPKRMLYPPIPAPGPLCFTPDGSLLVATDRENRLCWWSVATGRLARKAQLNFGAGRLEDDLQPGVGQLTSIGEIEVGPGPNRVVLVAEGGGWLGVFEDDRLTKQYRPGGDGWSVALSRNGAWALFATSGTESQPPYTDKRDMAPDRPTVLVYDVVSGREVRRRQDGFFEPIACAISPDGRSCVIFDAGVDMKVQPPRGPRDTFLWRAP